MKKQLIKEINHILSTLPKSKLQSILEDLRQIKKGANKGKDDLSRAIDQIFAEEGL